MQQLRGAAQQRSVNDKVWACGPPPNSSYFLFNSLKLLRSFELSLTYDKKLDLPAAMCKMLHCVIYVGQDTSEPNIKWQPTRFCIPT